MDLPTPSALRGRREFVRFYREQFAFAWRTLLRLGVPRSDCDDAAQDVFLTAHRRWPTLRDPDRRRAWLGGIVRRIAWRYRRTLQRRVRRHDAIAATSPEVRELDEEVARREAWGALARFLDDLDEPKRAAFVLGELEALGRIELGAALGVNPNTAYSRLLAARSSFLRHFAAIDDDRCAQLIARATEASDPPPEAHARGWAGLVAIVGAPASVASVATAWAAAALVVATTIGAVVPADDPAGSAPIAHVAEPASATTTEPRSAHPRAAPVAPTITTTPVSAPAQIRIEAPAHAPATRKDRSEAAPASAIEIEVAVLVQAREALVAGDSATARRHLADHRQRFGDGAALRELRAAIEQELADASITQRATGDHSSRTP